MSAWLDQMFVYHPAPWEERDWARISGLPLEDVWFEASDGVRLFGWFVPSAHARRSAPTMLWCHGNAGNIINRLDNLVALHRLGLSVLLFDYRGYGRSEGTPSEPGLYRDALAAYAHVVDERRTPPGRLVLFGRSLGATVAAAVASRKRAAGLVLESPFPSVAEVAQVHYFGLAHWLLSARFDLLERLPAVTIPILVVHGDRDEIIPIELGRRVYEAAGSPKAMYVVPGAGHNDLYVVGGRAYFQRVLQFVQEVTR